MSTATRFLIAFCCLIFGLSNPVSAQNISLFTQNPDSLYVCGVDQMTVTLQNANGSPNATTLRLSIVFPTGITYETGSVTGATEFNIGNLNAPVFSLADLGGGNQATVTLKIKGGCALVDAINSGQQFSNNITATYTGGSKQLTSNPYIVETGLANLISVTPVTVNAVQGDVIMRTIKLRNTRLGPISSLSFRDQHNGGISIELQGGNNPVNAATLFTADIPGSFFTAFGDGDDLLEIGDGEITLVEKVTVTSCGFPSFTTKSDIIVGWGCGGNTCRSDSIQAQITILPSNQNPLLVFEPTYARPLSYCGATPSVQEIRMINTGQLPANNVLLDIYTLDTAYMGFDVASFEWSYDRIVWQTADIQGSEPTVLASCGLSQYKLEVLPVIPLVPAGDTVYLRYNSYFCLPTCKGIFPRMRFQYAYNKACPPNVATTGLLNFFPDTAFLKVTTQMNFDIRHCLEDDSTYTLIYWVKSQRLTVDTGVLQTIIQLPFGLEWDPSCGLNLDGQTPLDIETSIDAMGTTTIRALFDMPFTQDSVGDEICIKYNCAAGLPCEAPVANVPPRGDDFTVYPPPSDCKGCELKVHVYSIISQTPDDTPDCGITACEEFNMVVDDVCNGGGGGGGGAGLGGGGSADLALTVGFDSWRVNRGFQDDNDDRQLDNNNKANAPGIRLDRFITGDTLRNELRIAILAGTMTSVNYRLFLESLMSDFGKQGGDPYEIPAGKKPFVNYDSTMFVGGHMIIKRPGGQTFTCPIDEPSIRSDQHIILVAEPNTRPPAVVDEMASMFDQYNLNIADFIAKGCLPAGFALAAGDSLFFQTDYKFTNNFTPLGGAAPPLVNFRTSVCDLGKVYSWELEDFCTEKPLRQFSGYLEAASPAHHRIEPCDESTETSPFRYGIRIARENMFPFEVRPISSIFGYSYSLPEAVALLSTKLTYLSLQENTPLFTNEPLTPTYGGDSIRLNLDPFFNKPLDEGYSFEISTKFDTTCGYNGTKFGRTNLSVRYANECIHNPVSVNYFIPNPNGYVNGSPELDFFPIGSSTISLNTNAVQFGFTIRNNSPVTAYNPWVIIDSDNNLSDVQLFLIDAPNLIPVPIVGGVYQLDSLPAFGQPFFRVVAKSNSCGTFTVRIRFGWGCSPKYNDQVHSCGEFEGSIELRPQPPELELLIVQQQTSVPLCAPSGNFEFEIANANEGSAYHVVPTVKLPTGFRVEPGTSRLSFPAGSAPVLMPDPVQLAGNVWQFNPEAISPALVQNGLVSFEQEPLNAMRISFKVRAECGAVANAQPVYGAEAIQPCGISSNRLRKPGQPIGINGVNTPNSASSSLSFTAPNTNASCGTPLEISASILLDGVPNAGDSIYILLPAGVSYVADSYVAGTNAPAGPPKISGQNLQLPLPTNIGATGGLNFTFKIRYDDPAGCIDRIITIQTREKSQAVCGNTQCDVYVATSEFLLQLNAQNPELQLNNFQLHTQSGGQTTFTANLENAGTANATDPVVVLYQDLNGNGLVDPGEPEVATVNGNGTISPGASLGITGNLTLPSSAYCGLIALIPADENCACADRVFPLGGKQVVVTGIGLCDPQPVPVGIPTVPGSTYNWLTINGMSCTNCSSGTYTPGPEVQVGDLVTLILEEKAGGCTIERRFNIQFGGSPENETSEETICQGRSASLQAKDGGIQYNWTGPGITNANQQNQIVTPMEDATYYVTVTYAGAGTATCSSTGTVIVNVKPVSKRDVSATVCKGEPVPGFPDVSSDVPGLTTHTYTYTSFNGCDSVVTLNLFVPDDQTEETINLCQGDSVTVFDEVFKTDGFKCRSFTTVDGCDSTHCVTIKVVANPNIPAQDSVIIQAGTEITLDGPSGYVTYDWTPPGDLSCSDCEDPVASPDTTTTFKLRVTDGNGCRDTVGYRVVTCDVEKYTRDIPNAFTPNGDGANDVFRPVPNEGAEMIVLLQIYNRWGTKLYEGRGPGAGWDGNDGGKPASSDVYVYILTAECSGVQKKVTGQVTLLR